MRLEKDDIYKIAPLVATVFILFGIANASIYYYIFGINILHYAQWNEYLFFFLDDLVDIATLIFIFLFARAAADIAQPDEKKTGDKGWPDRRILIPMVIVLVTGLLLSLKITRSIFLRGAIGTYFIYFFVFAIFFYNLFIIRIAPDAFFAGLLKKQQSRGSFSIHTLFLKFFGAILVVIAILIFPPYLKAYRLINVKSSRTEIVLYLKEKTKVTTDSLIFLGKTTSYYFFYDIAGKQAQIIENAGIDSIRIKRRPFRFFAAIDPMEDK